MNWGHEVRITEGGVFGPVFANGVCPDRFIHITEGIVEFGLLRGDAVLTVEMTVEAADLLAERLRDTVNNYIAAPERT